MPRLFVSVAIPESVKQGLARISYGVPGARWAELDQIHLTLRFIGDVDGAGFRDVDEALAEIEAPAFSLTLQGLGHFPPRGEPRVLWAGVEKNPGLSHLRRKVEVALQRAGLEPEHRKFAPHVTIAKVASAPPVKLAEFLSRNSTFRSEPFLIDEFHLYSSELTPKRAWHRLEASFGLGLDAHPGQTSETDAAEERST